MRPPKQNYEIQVMKTKRGVSFTNYDSRDSEYYVIYFNHNKYNFLNFQCREVHAR